MINIINLLNKIGLLNCNNHMNQRVAKNIIISEDNLYNPMAKKVKGRKYQKVCLHTQQPTGKPIFNRKEERQSNISNNKLYDNIFEIIGKKVTNQLQIIQLKFKQKKVEKDHFMEIADRQNTAASIGKKNMSKVNELAGKFKEILQQFKQSINDFMTELETVIRQQIFNVTQEIRRYEEQVVSQLSAKAKSLQKTSVQVKNPIKCNLQLDVSSADEQQEQDSFRTSKRLYKKFVRKSPQTQRNTNKKFSFQTADPLRSKFVRFKRNKLNQSLSKISSTQQ